MMRTNVLSFIKNIVFVIFFILLILFLNETFMIKYMYDQTEPHTETYDGFYQMEKILSIF